MAKIDSKKALVGLGVLGVAGLAGAAFAASVSIPPSNAGQGDDVTEGFVVTAVEYDATPATNEEQANVDVVRFDIARENQTLVVADANAEAFVQLRDATGRSDWAQCDLTAGAATCDTSGAGATMDVEVVTGISVVAYDTLESALLPG